MTVRDLPMIENTDYYDEMGETAREWNGELADTTTICARYVTKIVEDTDSEEGGFASYTILADWTITITDPDGTTPRAHHHRPGRRVHAR